MTPFSFRLMLRLRIPSDDSSWAPGTAPTGVEVIPLQPKRLALLAYLAVVGVRGALRRDTLLGLFWPESSEEEARRALRQASTI